MRSNMKSCRALIITAKLLRHVLLVAALVTSQLLAAQTAPATPAAGLTQTSVAKLSPGEDVTIRAQQQEKSWRCL